VEIAVGLEHGLRLPFEQQRELLREAARLGYESAWTNAGLGYDPFQVCERWSAASAEVVDGGLATGISVLPVPMYTAPALAAAAATTSVLTGGRFSLGVGSGGIHSAEYRRSLGLTSQPPIALMRDYLIVLRRLLEGETVDYDGPAVHLLGIQLGVRPPRVPICLGALGPQMLRLAGEEADGAALNWSTPEQVAWSRERIAEGAERVGRDPSTVRVIEYIRICVDEDEELARQALARAILGYALARPGVSKELGYRGHFARMGFDAALTNLEERRDQGASETELVEQFPQELLRLVGYYGPAAGAAAAFRRLAEGLDLAIVRVVPSRPEPQSILDVMRACRPELVRGA
jgi:alkanesulfonate monooxygenase SsuD/methylene tetrahydromethanopterin reductase-like flavin-dependent oxidoreductase (luciferase family)